MHLLQSILDWSLSALGTYGYLIVLVATCAENLFLVGSFVPGDIITAAAAFTATTPQGAHLSIWVLLGVATVGSLIGMNASDLIGVRGGRELLERIGPRFGVTVEAIEGGEEYFERHGAVTILLARFVAVFKNLSPAIAGASRMRIVVFELFALIASLGYAAALMAIGWFLGENFQAGLKYFGAFSWVAFLIVAAVIFVAWRGKRTHDAKLIAQNAAEFEAEHGRILVEEETDGDA
jgi:membrane-associated protein